MTQRIFFISFYQYTDIVRRPVKNFQEATTHTNNFLSIYLYDYHSGIRFWYICRWAAGATKPIRWHGGVDTVVAERKEGD